MKVYKYEQDEARETLLGWPLTKDMSAIKVGGCGMDIGFHTVYTLSHELFGDGCALKQEWI